MDSRLVYTEKALTDLQQVLGHIAEEDPEAALRFGTSLLDHIELLVRFPRIGNPVARKPGVRKLLHSPIFVYYHFDERKREIRILHLRHGARKPPSSAVGATRE